MVVRLAVSVCVALVVVSVRAGSQAVAPGTFLPTVEISDTTASCEQITPAALQPDERGFLLQFGHVDSPLRSPRAWRS